MPQMRDGRADPLSIIFAGRGAGSLRVRDVQSGIIDIQDILGIADLVL